MQLELKFIINCFDTCIGPYVNQCFKDMYAGLSCHLNDPVQEKHLSKATNF